MNPIDPCRCRGASSVATLALSCLLAPTLSAQQPGALDRFSAAETPDDDLHLSRPTDQGHLRLAAQIHLDYAKNPLVWEDALGNSGSERFGVVEHQLVSTVGVSLGLYGRVVVYAGLPAALWMAGANQETLSPFNLRAADSAGLGEGYLGGRVRILGSAQDRVALAAQLTAQLPTGAYGGQVYRSGDGPGLHPELLAEAHPFSSDRVVVNLGMRLRSDGQASPDRFTLGDELSFGLGYALPVWRAASDEDTHLDVQAQIYGATRVSSFFDREHTPLEGTTGLKLSHASGMTGGVAAGPGLTRGIGSPDLRVVGMLGYALPEDSDRDADGVENESDPCPDDAEDVDSFEDGDGCPEPDNDGDEVLDDRDACPLEPGVADNRGCPDTDRDGDAVVDRVDNCPDSPGSVENRGCETEQKVKIESGRLDISERIFFELDRSELSSRSFDLLLNVARVIAAHPEIRRIRVEGHTDERGTREHNLELSQARTESVVRYLVDAGGVQRDRLHPVGLGADYPLAPNAATPEEHAQNRRVEFKIEDDSRPRRLQGAAEELRRSGETP